jgi:dehydrogenase/reductase SDR family protein 12
VSFTNALHPGRVETPGVADALPMFRVVTGPLLRDTSDGADTALWLVATRPESSSGHFWHDGAQRPTTFGWERAEDPELVTRFLAAVTSETGTKPFTAKWQEAHHD